MYDDIIDGNDQICSACWWSTGKIVLPAGHIYCSLYKKNLDEKYGCDSWRHRFTREILEKADVDKIRAPKWKFNLNV